LFLQSVTQTITYAFRFRHFATQEQEAIYSSLMSVILTHTTSIHIFYRLGVIQTVFCLPYYPAHFVHFISFNLKHTKYEILVSLVCTPSEQQTYFQ